MILSQLPISFSDTQIKMIRSGWGEKVIEDVNVSKIVYEVDGLEINGYLAYPKDTTKKYPCIIWNRGGNFKDGRIDEFLAQGIFGEIASWGYIVLSSQYRDKDEFGGKDLNDVLALLTIADELDYCDSTRIGMEGWSRGGMMTYLALTRTNRVKCAVIISGLADLFRSQQNRSDLNKVYRKIFGSDEKIFELEIKKRSAVNFADKINKDTHILLIHGTADQKVSYFDSKMMYELMKKEGIDCEIRLVESGDHYLRKHREDLIEIRKKWFDKFLK